MVTIEVGTDLDLDLSARSRLCFFHGLTDAERVPIDRLAFLNAAISLVGAHAEITKTVPPEVDIIATATSCDDTGICTA